MNRLNENRLKIAIQKGGRLTEDTIDLLKRSGLDFEVYGNRLFSSCQNFPLDILFLRDDDIPEYVQDGVCDLGVVGANVLQEREAKVSVLERLGFGRCRLCLAVPKNGPYKKVEDLNNTTVATSYPTILGQFLKQRNVNASIVLVKGSVEITPSLEIADAICDVVSSGTTLKSNGLEILETVLESEAVLVQPLSLKNKSLQGDLDRLLMRLRATLVAQKNKYVMMNAPESALAAIEKILPGLESPTVVPLAEKGMIAVHSVVPEDTFWEVMENLKKAGASGILVVPIEKMIL